VGCELTCLATALFRKYFADHFLNVDDAVVNFVKDHIETKNFPRSLFEDAQKFVFLLMETACVSKYVNSSDSEKEDCTLL
jgi:hypothetical protein